VVSNAQGAGPGEESVYTGPTGTWLLYTPRYAGSPKSDASHLPVAIARLGFGSTGPYIATWADPPSPPAVVVPATPIHPSPVRIAPPTR
jgi:hypothetical protein